MTARQFVSLPSNVVARNRGKNCAAADLAMGILLLQARQKKDMSQMDLAEKCGISFQQIQKYEKGTNAMAQARLQQIAAALELPITYFYTGSTKPLSGEVEKIWEGLDARTALRLLRAYTKMDREDGHRLVLFMESLASV